MPTFSGRDVLYRDTGRSRANRSAPVDAFEQHRELGATQTDHTFVRLRPDEATALETLGKQAQAIAIPPQQFNLNSEVEVGRSA
jgi:hypothetical protein